MRYEIFTDLGGFLWWVLVKFGNTNLKDEQKEEKWPRNLFFLIIIGVLIGLIISKLSL